MLPRTRLALTVCAAVVGMTRAALPQQAVPAPNIALDHQRTMLTLTFPTSPPVAWSMEAASVDRLIVDLGRHRAEMDPRIPQENPQEATPIQVAAPGRWFLIRYPDKVRLAILHPGLGWVGLDLHNQDADALTLMLLSKPGR